MGRDWTLFDRLKPRSGSSSSVPARSASDQVASILRHLQRLLNSRQGHAAAQMGYGIPDPSEVLHGSAESVVTMAKAIKASIEQYEPRLKDVQVRFVAAPEDVLSLKYQIVGQLANTKERVPVVFESHVDHCGRIRVV